MAGPMLAIVAAEISIMPNEPERNLCCWCGGVNARGSTSVADSFPGTIDSFGSNEITLPSVNRRAPLRTYKVKHFRLD